MLAFAAGLRSLGVQAGDRVSLFSENSSRWLVADQGIMFNGAADAVRFPATAPAFSSRPGCTSGVTGARAIQCS
jgi:long-subunit acyl-CoA synthetase (AMP-forming)